MSSEFSPNVIEAQKEKGALDKCYQTAVQKAKGRGVENLLPQFEKMVKTESHVVVNMKTAVLKKLIEKSGEFYKNHYEMGKHDPDRENMDLRLYGEAGKKIRYAALSLDGTGLTDYGNCHCQIRLTSEEEMNTRVNVFRINSYFLKRAPLIPLGYRACWKDRHLLAVVKLWDRLEIHHQENEFPRILLDDQGDRKDDEFIEVHIYDAFDSHAIVSVKGTPQTVKKAPEKKEKEELTPEEKEKEELEFAIVKKTLEQQEKWKN